MPDFRGGYLNKRWLFSCLNYLGEDFLIIIGRLLDEPHLLFISGKV
jgi:hypothetical protein